jgi:Fic family protein
MKIVQIEKPNLKKYRESKLETYIQLRIAQTYKNYQILAFEPEYLYWDKLKYKMPDEIKHKEEFWIAVKEYRKAVSIKTPIKNENQEFFTWIKLPSMEKFLHFIDLNFAGKFKDLLELGFEKPNEKIKNKFRAKGLLEESIASSQLEGANTTRKMAKEMIRTGRKPRDKSEQMILNNYQAMKLIDEEYKEKKLSKSLLFEIHEILTKNTLDQKDIGRFRNDHDDIVVSKDSEIIYFIPPKAEFVEKEMDRLIRFANDEDNEPFIHPLIKAIMIHFWIGYLHPFCDGNGRLARILFYWYLIKKGYWVFFYLSFSSLLLKSRAQYEKAYLYSEQDDHDLTYFINYNVLKIQASIEHFLNYLQKNEEKRAKKEDLAVRFGLNQRQIELLEHFIEHPEDKTTPTIHKNIYRTSKLTAIKDLKILGEKGFLLVKKVGRNKYYYPSPNLKSFFQLPSFD